MRDLFLFIWEIRIRTRMNILKKEWREKSIGKESNSCLRRRPSHGMWKLTYGDRWLTSETTPERRELLNMLNNWQCPVKCLQEWSNMKEKGKRKRSKWSTTPTNSTNIHTNLTLARVCLISINCIRFSKNLLTGKNSKWELQSPNLLTSPTLTKDPKETTWT